MVRHGCIMGGLLVVLQLSAWGTLYSQSLVINEFLASNNAGISDEDGQRNDWIEFYNPSTVSINLEGLGLTDDFARPQQWIFPAVVLPAKGYLLVWASGKDRKDPAHLHTNFKLEKSGKRIGLYRTNLSVMDSVSFGAQVADITSGRYPDGEGWITPLIPSPAAANRLTISPPQFSVAQGFYSTSQTLTLTTNVTPSVIRYTLDGSNPESSSPRYSTPLYLSATTIIRAATFLANGEHSIIVTSSYFIGENITTPVLSLVIDPDSLYNSSRGIYTNYDSSGDAWERQAHVAFFDAAKAIGFDEECGIRIHGSASRKYAKKSFRVYFRADYGVEHITYLLFPDAGVPWLSRIVVHAGGEDQLFYPGRWELLKNALIRCLGAGTSHLAAACRPAVVFLNGQFWGVYFLRERIDDDYLQDHYGFTTTDLLEGTGQYEMEAEEGNLDQWHYTWEYFNTHDLSNQQYYLQALQLIDPDNFVDYIIINSYSGNHDWPHNNFFMFRSWSGDTRWRWLIWDCDHTFANYYLEDVTLNSIKWILRSTPTPELKIWGSADQEKYLWATRMLRSLVKNSQFRDSFISRYADLLNTSLSPSTGGRLVDSLAALIRHEIPRERSKWEQYADPEATVDWEANVAFQKDYLQRRPDYLRQYLVSEFGLAGTATVNVTSLTGQGSVRINTVTLAALPWSGKYFKGLPLRLKAKAGLGFRFLNWGNTGLPASDSVQVTLNGDLTVRPTFEALPPAQTLALAGGWSLISSRISPENTAIAHMLSGVDLTILKDQNGKIYWPDNGIDQISTWDSRQGYYIYIAAPAELILYGQPITPENMPLPLRSGWNMSAYLRSSSMPIEQALAGILNRLTIAKNDAGQVFWPELSINTIGQMTAGKGYLLFLNQAATLTYPANAVTLARGSCESLPEPRYFIAVNRTAGHTAHLLITGLQESEGSELGVVSEDGTIVGSGVVSAKRALLTIWGDDPLTQNLCEGAREGESLRLIIRPPDASSEAEFILNGLTDALSGSRIGSLRYHRDGVWLAQGAAAAGELSTEAGPVIYPNPFNQQTVISWAGAKGERFEAMIYNIRGELLRTLVSDRASGAAQIRFDGRSHTGELLPSGLYLIKLTAGGKTLRHKITILR